MKITFAFLVASLALSIITLVVTIAINATVANEPDNDYSRNFGWGILTPAPAISLVWSIVDIAVYHILQYHAIHWLMTCVFLGSLNAALGIVGVLAYEWDDAAWVAGMFIIFAAVFYFVFMGFAAAAVHRYRQGQESGKTALKNVESAD